MAVCPLKNMVHGHIRNMMHRHNNEHNDGCNDVRDNGHNNGCDVGANGRSPLQNDLPGLPKGWVWTRLGEIVIIKYGKDLSTKQISSNDKYPVFGANGIIGFYKEYVYEEQQVLISCRGAYSGKINYSPSKCFVTHNSLVLEVNDKFKDIKKYLYYVLQSVDT